MVPVVNKHVILHSADLAPMICLLRRLVDGVVDSELAGHDLRRPTLRVDSDEMNTWIEVAVQTSSDLIESTEQQQIISQAVRSGSYRASCCPT